MADATFNPGDVVVLKSGSPKLTVVTSNEETTYFIYYSKENSKVMQDVYNNSVPTVSLRKATSDD